jgi:hypothetical protein
MMFRTVTFQKSISLPIATLLMGVSLIAALVACSSSSNSGSNGPSVSIGTVPTPTPASLNVLGTLSLQASVLNDHGGVNWSCTPGNAPATCGSFSASSSPSGEIVGYTAPSTVPSSPVVITATLADNSSVSASTSAITITNITITLSAVPTSLQVSATQSITATVANDADNAGVTWSCVPLGACGTFSSSTSASGAPVTYSAPANVPQGNTVTITASSVTDGSVFASVTVTITAAVTTTPGLADGNYVFSLAGSDFNGTYSVVGAFTVLGGAITTGEQDLGDFTIYEHDAITGGSALISADGNVLVTITTGDSRIGANGTETLDATVVSPSKALLTEFDSWATSSGELDLQATTFSTPSGSYAFSAAGVDVNEKPLSLGGVINIDNPGSISGAGSIFDINDDGVPLAAQTFASGSVGVPDGFGLVDFTLTPSSASGVGRIVLVGYVIDASHIRLIEHGAVDVFRGTVGGSALGQTGTGTFDAGSLSASSYVVGAAGPELPGAQQLASVLTFNADGSVSGTLSYNDLKTQTPQGGSTLVSGATYSVASTGDVTLTGLTGIADITTGTTFTYNLQLYLTGDGNALVISMDTADVLAGRGFLQTGGGSFNAASFSGSYALNVVQKLPIPPFERDGVGTIAADGVATLTGFVDLNELHPTTDVLLTGTFAANPNGVFTGTISGISSIDAPSDNFTYYLVDTTQVLAIETDTDQLTLGYFELQQ